MGMMVHCAKCDHQWDVPMKLPIPVDRFVKAALGATAGGCPQCGAHGKNVLCGPSVIAATRPPYDGPIDIGMYFIWEPDNPKAWQHVMVSRIDERPHDERAIWVVHIRTTPGLIKEPVWNDESRFREACVRADERGNRL